MAPHVAWDEAKVGQKVRLQLGWPPDLMSICCLMGLIKDKGGGDIEKNYKSYFGLG